ncbi:endonuclease/exonuclease/phosphatase family metal-dependent hydrolase [Breoghania corrubedonensis]|uniref:Endonuclease/exonuclease/phosphatase family metal-dependent hydrolase n=1 Tax=Breoghania corrubedonensis TaxID=665038 RepID=A0A2T5V6L2_9HYPH|nr:endonuclease/exonuclease/phosphatase family protein [Breoghania corrubedonensis]PTW59387.1 endonuclease/exonuclease/phosphatase family metal-dependent hydrolase [Breoghania corrubedonensis]
MSEPGDDRPVRLMTWNIHGGVGADGRFDLARVSDVIRRHDPDIVALQEVDTRGRDIDCLAPLKTLHEDSGHWREARTIEAPDGRFYGHAILSRWPMRESVLHDLSIARREPRSAIEAIIESPGGALHLISVHLGLKLAERRMQARKLAALAGNRRAATSVALGDFNDWFTVGAVRRAMRQVLPVRTMVKTFPARWPLLRLDRIYCRAPHNLLRVWSDEQARACSDHLPVIADIRLSAHSDIAPAT